MKTYGVIMAGGSGERFWPLSTPAMPKQLLDLTGSGDSLLAQAKARLVPVVDELFVSTTELLREPILDSGLFTEDQILAEPAKRNTAGALIWSMAKLSAATAGPFLCAVTTADHAISPDEAFQADVRQALVYAENEDALVTIGIPPTRPETGYGYIEIGDAPKVSRFTEKPDPELATSFLAAGNYLWNSGMFFWRSDTFERELKMAESTMGAIYVRIADALRTGVDPAAAFEELPSISIDYALMERAKRVACFPATFRWDDVGTWDSLLRTVPLDNEGNAIVGKATLLNTTRCVVYNGSGRTLCVSGLDDQIIVATCDAMLVTPMSRAQDVREAAKKHSQQLN